MNQTIVLSVRPLKISSPRRFRRNDFNRYSQRRVALHTFYRNDRLSVVAGVICLEYRGHSKKGQKPGALMGDRMTIERARRLVGESDGGNYGVLLQHGTLEIGYYVPPPIDPQKPHDQDEVYIVQSGSGTFVLGDSEQTFEPGEALFVPAGVHHRFVDHTPDFAAWVVFYGPSGGESV